MKIEVLLGDLTEQNVEAIVNPANSLGVMGGGVAGVIKRKGGEEIEKEAMKKAPIPVGEAVVTTGGKLPCRYIIHSPTMRLPAMHIPIKNVTLATRAALKKAAELKVKSLAFPGMGTGVGGVDVNDAAKVMIKEIKRHGKEYNHPEVVLLVAFESKLYDAFKKWSQY